MTKPMKSKNRTWKYVGLCIALLALCIFSGLVGGVIGKHIGINNHQVSYSDFISILLSAISLLMTLLGFGLAIFGVIGWNSVSSRIKERTNEFLDSGFNEDGILAAKMRGQFGTYLQKGFEEDGDLKAIFLHQISTLMYKDLYGDIPDAGEAGGVGDDDEGIEVEE